MDDTQLYIISPEKIDVAKFSIELESALSTGKVAVFQLRLKNIDDDEILLAAKTLLPICRRHNVVFILNDRADLAKKSGADGVHVGEEKDGTYDDARKIMGEEKIVGVSCYGSIDRAIDFASKGADYVAFGAFYDTDTKTPKARPDVDVLQWWVRNATVSCVAIGGIKAHNCTKLVKAGADYIAVVTAIWNHEKGAKQGVLDMAKAIEEAR